MKHKNATAAAVTTAISTFAVWIADKAFHYELSQVYGALIAGAVVTGVLFVGKRGIKGTALAIWNGGLTAWAGTGTTASAPKP